MTWIPRNAARLTALLVTLSGAAPAVAFAQTPVPAPATTPSGNVIGIGPYLHLVDDLDRSLAFYRALLGAEPTGTAEARAWGHNEPVAVMYGAPGAEIRTVSLAIPGSEMYVELVAWRGVPRPAVHPRIADPGTATLLLFVRDMNAALSAVTRQGGSILTPTGTPVVVRDRSRFVLVQDPDGFFIELLQTNPLPAGAATTGNIVLGRFRTTAGDAEQTARFYRDGLGFALPTAGTLAGDPTLRAITGLATATSRLVVGTVPGSSVTFEIAEFGNVDRARVRSSIHGVGASMLRLRVDDIDAVFARVRDAGATPVTAQPVTLSDNRRMVIVEDPNGMFLQLWQVAPQATPARR
jgi:predicted enzyme related to lactoylglutathione lyase